MKITKLISFGICTWLCCTGLLLAQQGAIKSNSSKPRASEGISFIENKGQMHDQNNKPRPDVLFGAASDNLIFHLKKSGVSYQMSRIDKFKEIEDPNTGEKTREAEEQTIYRIDLNWINANSNFVTKTDQALNSFSNFYTSGTPNGGALKVKSYTGFTLQNLYNGIDLHYYEKGGQLKHDYIVAVGANYKQIQLEVKGADVTIHEDGSLFLNTPLGIVMEGAPVVFQNGKRLKAKWVISKEQQTKLSFDIEGYDPNQELIIDPITRVWGTYYGGTGGNEQANRCITNGAGEVYMAGTTNSINSTSIATSGSHQSAYAGGTSDAFLIKFDGNGVRLWGTYYGGTAADLGLGCAVDVDGYVYLSGTTSSQSPSEEIATIGSHQPSLNGSSDAFLVKFRDDGTRLWGTYYGGLAGENGYSCSVDNSEGVYMAGLTGSNSDIATPGTYQDAYMPSPANQFRAYLVKFRNNGVREWGTYYGGSASTRGYGCAADISNNVYLCGFTTNTDPAAIASTGAHQSSHGGALQDAFLVQFNASVGTRQWGTYYGGTGSETALSCASDVFGNVYMTGLTSSESPSEEIATFTSHQPALNGANDAFLVRFRDDGTRMWGTYYGGSLAETGFDCTVDNFGNVYMSGQTNSTSPAEEVATAFSHQDTYGGNQDAFLVNFDENGIRLWGTYYGGNQAEIGYSCAVDVFQNVFLCGITNSASTSDEIATLGSHQNLFGGGVSDGFLAKFQFVPCGEILVTAEITHVCDGGDDYNGAIDITVSGGMPNYTYLWSNGATTQDIFGLAPGNYSVTVTDAYGCSVTTTFIIYNLYPQTKGDDCYVVNENNCVYNFVNQFANLSNTIPGLTNTVEWTIWDGNPSNPPVVIGNTWNITNYTFSSGSDYEICVTVTNTLNGQSCSNQCCQVINGVCTLDCPEVIDANFNFNGLGNQFTFTNTSASNGGTPTGNIVWNWGDGSTNSYPYTSGIPPVYSHTYASSGFYDVCITVYYEFPDHMICSETFCQTVVYCGEPVGCATADFFGYQNSSSYVGYFNGSVLPSTFNVTSYEWYFGIPGAFGTGQNTSYAYPPVSPGSSSDTYMVTLMVTGTDEDGNVCVFCITKEVTIVLIDGDIVGKGAQVIPNPNNGIFTIRLDENENLENVTIRVRDNLGSTVYQNTERNLNIIRMDLSALTPGTYTVELRNDEVSITERIVIVK